MEQESGEREREIDVWQNKIRKLRKKLKGWSINIESAKKKRICW